MKKITTVILAAGNSSRFKHSKSKIFQDLAGLPIIDHVYQIANKISPKNVIFVCNKNNIEDLKNKFLNAKFITQNQQRGTADAISCAKKYLKDSNILILFGDAPLISSNSIKKLIKNFYKNNSIGSMIAFKTKNPYGYGRVKVRNNFVTSVVEELNASKFERKINLCNSGVMLCSSSLLFNNISKISNNNIKKEKFLPDIFSIFNNLNLSFSYVLGSEDEMLGVNTIQDLINIEAIFQKKIKDKIINGGVILQKPESIHLSFDTKIKQGSNIEPFVFIKPGVSIKNNVNIKSHSILEKCTINSFSSIGPSARIRPYTKIGKNVKIGNFVEVKNSVIGDSTSISHLSYIGDSKLGKNINIGAGTITCNYDGKRKNKTIINDNVFVGSNCSLVAPITIGKNSTIGAGSVITKSIPKNHLALERSEIRILRKIRKK
jgi:bifunctional UDP-N-acetylglucosamine pyrophosphorylase/glucosamine-1-phosphate N-acetyltransferase